MEKSRIFNDSVTHSINHPAYLTSGAITMRPKATWDGLICHIHQHYTTVASDCQRQNGQILGDRSEQGILLNLYSVISRVKHELERCDSAELS